MFLGTFQLPIKHAGFQPIGLVVTERHHPADFFCQAVPFCT